MTVMTGDPGVAAERGGITGIEPGGQIAEAGRVGRSGANEMIGLDEVDHP